MHEHYWTAHFDEETQRYYWMCCDCSRVTFRKKD